MRIRHEETGVEYEISENNGNFRLHDSATNRSYSFNEAYEAIWMTIEIIRNSSLESLAEDHLQTITKRAHLNTSAVPKALLSSLKKEKINRTYYDQLFLKILSCYRNGHTDVVISNKTNFVLDHELNFLLRKSLGVNLFITSHKS